MSSPTGPRQRQKQTGAVQGAVQAFKIASEAQSYLEGGNIGDYVNKKPNFSSYTAGAKGKASGTPGAANNVIKNRISGDTRQGVNLGSTKPASRIKVNKSPINGPSDITSGTGQKKEQSILATSVLTAT